MFLCGRKNQWHSLKIISKKNPSRLTNGRDFLLNPGWAAVNLNLKLELKTKN
ncbi:hypothetical protein SAMN05444355_10284 [Flavobacterium frigoris]|uniref:Uncharacterized protein n=1 Tax=Flavobacterium frigoris TaxID=229204 RepID=A0A1H9F5G7_FLAFI|nr:hypothetical protein SAMN05444355_10284 [Flavobacterium frigoris]